ncbi:calcium-binding protein [Nocardioides sp. HM23]|uniref:calcium-binding protein n=1 Tax=Nocardioides bizhenqiangii TaxID=3095076 RepID=UPI002ACADFA9|nr:calcium-binding protein [Nocardioides sp. HM23]MDZ5621785.1 calcium-binding protein [Nocardioides sp. HM23]
MATRVGCVLIVAVLSAVSASCTAGTEGESSSDSSLHPSKPESSTEVSSATSEPAPTNAGTRAPRDGEPGFDSLPECFGRRATLLGGPGDDRITGTRRRDVIVARGGDDVVTGLGEADYVCGGAGNDRVRSTHKGFPAVWGIDLGSGDDRVHVVNADEILGGSGDDRMIFVRGPGQLSGGPGADYLQSMMTNHPYYPENAPCLSYEGAAGPVRVDLARGRARGEGRDRLVNFWCLTGSRHSDTLLGTAGGDGISGGAGPDVVRAGAGDDSVDGGQHADRLYLGPGSDYGLGSTGPDRLYGEQGDDNLEGWSDSDYLDGGPGDDEIYAALFCAIGINSYDTAGLMDGAPNELFGGPGDDYLVGDKGNDRLDGGEGYDVGQGGYRDGRIDWMESIDRYIDGCLPGGNLMMPGNPGRTPTGRSR